TPLVGNGQWSILSGTGGSFDDVTDPEATFSGTPGETYELQWTISNAPCAPSSDEVAISFASITPQLAGVTPPAGDYCQYGENFIWTVQASDANLHSLEVDHSMEDVLPEFTVYADAGDPYGSLEALAEF